MAGKLEGQTKSYQLEEATGWLWRVAIVNTSGEVVEGERSSLLTFSLSAHVRQETKKWEVLYATDFWPAEL